MQYKILLLLFVVTVASQDCEINDPPYADLENLAFNEDGIPQQGNYRVSFENNGRKTSCTTEYDAENSISATYDARSTVTMRIFTQFSVKAHDFQNKAPYASSRVYCTDANKCTTLAADAIMCHVDNNKEGNTYQRCQTGSKFSAYEDNIRNSDIDVVIENIKNNKSCYKIDGMKVLASGRNNNSIQIVKTKFVENNRFSQLNDEFYSRSSFSNIRTNARNRVLLDSNIKPCVGTILTPATEESTHNVLTRYCTFDALNNKIIFSSRAAFHYDRVYTYESTCPEQTEKYKIFNFARPSSDSSVVAYIQDVEDGKIVENISLTCYFSIDEANARLSIIRSIVENSSYAELIYTTDTSTSITVYNGYKIIVNRISTNRIYLTTYGIRTDDFEQECAYNLPRVYVSMIANEGLCSIRNLSSVNNSDEDGTRLAFIIEETTLRANNRFVSPEQLVWISSTQNQIDADNNATSWSNVLLTCVATVAAFLGYPSGPIARTAWKKARNVYTLRNESQAIRKTLFVCFIYTTISMATAIAQLIFLITTGKSSYRQNEFNSVTFPAFVAYELFTAYERVYVRLNVDDKGWIYKILLVLLSCIVGLFIIFSKARMSHRKYTPNPALSHQIQII